MKILVSVKFVFFISTIMFFSIFYLFGISYSVFSAIFCIFFIIIFNANSENSSFYIYSIRIFVPIGISILTISIYKYTSQFISVEYTVYQNTAPFSAFIQIVSTLYAVSIAFLLLKGVQDHDELESLIGKKCSNVRSISDYLYYFEEDVVYYKEKKSIIDIRKYLKNYLVAFIVLIESEFSEIEKKNLSIQQKILREKISKLDCKDENDKVALQEIVKSSNLLSDHTDKIVSNINSKMSTILLVFIVIISIICVVSFFDGSYCSFNAASVLIFSMTFLFSFIFIMIIDMNNPYKGKWCLDYSSVRGVMEYVTKSEAEIKERKPQSS